MSRRGQPRHAEYHLKCTKANSYRLPWLPPGGSQGGFYVFARGFIKSQLPAATPQSGPLGLTAPLSGALFLAAPLGAAFFCTVRPALTYNGGGRNGYADGSKIRGHIPGGAPAAAPGGGDRGPGGAKWPGGRGGVGPGGYYRPADRPGGGGQFRSCCPGAGYAPFRRRADVRRAAGYDAGGARNGGPEPGGLAGGHPYRRRLRQRADHGH